MASRVWAGEWRAGNKHGGMDGPRAHDPGRADRIPRDCNRSNRADPQAGDGPGSDLRFKPLIASGARPGLGARGSYKTVYSFGLFIMGQAAGRCRVTPARTE